eukprot:2637335-Rhodomonas_salina.1
MISGCIQLIGAEEVGPEQVKHRVVLSSTHRNQWRTHPEIKYKKPHLQYKLYQECGFFVFEFAVYAYLRALSAITMPEPKHERSSGWLRVNSLLSDPRPPSRARSQDRGSRVRSRDHVCDRRMITCAISG